MRLSTRQDGAALGGGGTATRAPGTTPGSHGLRSTAKKTVADLSVTVSHSCSACGHRPVLRARLQAPREQSFPRPFPLPTP